MATKSEERKWTSISIPVSIKEALERLGKSYKAGFVGPDGTSYAASDKALTATQVVKLLLFAELERRGIGEAKAVLGDEVV